MDIDPCNKIYAFIRELFLILVLHHTRNGQASVRFARSGSDGLKETDDRFLSAARLSTAGVIVWRRRIGQTVSEYGLTS
jgi:hypothetical protein